MSMAILAPSSSAQAAHEETASLPTILQVRTARAKSCLSWNAIQSSCICPGRIIGSDHGEGALHNMHFLCSGGESRFAQISWFIIAQLCI